MAYIDGFVIPVPSGNRDAYLALAKKAAPVFLEHGATRVVEAWGDDIKPGKTNDFRTAVLAEEGESVIFSSSNGPQRKRATPVTKRSWLIRACNPMVTCRLAAHG
jgi:uncharacterized protein YbaA (DUF1428 family)